MQDFSVIQEEEEKEEETRLANSGDGEVRNKATTATRSFMPYILTEIMRTISIHLCNDHLVKNPGIHVIIANIS